MSIQKFIRKHKILDYIQKCIRYSKDEDFISVVLDYKRNYELLILDGYTDKDNKEILYHIYIDNELMGFFAIVHEVLRACYFAEKMYMIPIISWSQSVKYAEKEAVNGTDNPYEYYFQQPTCYSFSNINSFSKCARYYACHGQMVDELNNANIYQLSDSYISALADIKNKYINFNKPTEDRLLSDSSMLFKGCTGKILGVHYRGTDFKVGYKDHPIKADLQVYLESIEKLIKKGIYERIFVATDDIEALHTIKGIYGQQILSYNDVVRSDGNKSVIFSENNRVHHHYELGYEVLRDMWTLSKCDGLIAGLSQVSNCSRIYKRSYNETYIDEIIIDLGVKNTGKNFRG